MLLTIQMHSTYFERISIFLWKKEENKLHTCKISNFTKWKISLKLSHFFTHNLHPLDGCSPRQGVASATTLYSVVGLNMRFDMNWSRYIFLYYIPTALIVMTSWIFFLLPSTSYPARLEDIWDRNT